jgi:hypothetical protein
MKGVCLLLEAKRMEGQVSTLWLFLYFPSPLIGIMAGVVATYDKLCASMDSDRRTFSAVLYVYWMVVSMVPLRFGSRPRHGSAATP